MREAENKSAIEISLSIHSKSLPTLGEISVAPLSVIGIKHQQSNLCHKFPKTSVFLFDFFSAQIQIQEVLYGRCEVTGQTFQLHPHRLFRLLRAAEAQHELD